MSAKQRVIASSGKGLSGKTALLIIGVVIVVLVGSLIASNQFMGGPALLPTPLPFETGRTPEGFPYKGAAGAPVTIVSYSDYKCGHCARFALEIEPLIDQHYVATGKVKFVSHYFGFSPATQALTAGAACAAEQGKFWEMDHVLFANQRAVTADNLLALGRQIGLDFEAFKECLRSGDNRAKVAAATRQASAAGVDGTPIFFVNGKKVVGAASFEQFRLEIDQALAAGP